MLTGLACEGGKTDPGSSWSRAVRQANRGSTGLPAESRALLCWGLDERPGQRDKPAWLCPTSEQESGPPEWSRQWACPVWLLITWRMRWLPLVDQRLWLRFLMKQRKGAPRGLHLAGGGLSSSETEHTLRFCRKTFSIFWARLCHWSRSKRGARSPLGSFRWHGSAFMNPSHKCQPDT